MALAIIEQITQLIANNKRFLITFKRHFDGDALGSALALRLMLTSLGKQADIVCDDFVLPEKFSFLPETDHIVPRMGDLHQFIISLDIEHSGISELSYDTRDNKLRIFITPKHGYINKDSISTTQTDYKYDAIFVLDTPDLASLGNIHTRHEDFFYSVPVINIDHKSSNEQFGTINHVVQPASSTSEIMFDILTHIAQHTITQPIAQCLLTGIISGTTGFRHKKVRPQTLQIASQLTDMGADRAHIMKRIFQTKSIGTFRLWGNALSHLQYDPEHHMVWTTLTRDDFKRNNAHVYDVHAIIDELITTSPDAQYILVLFEDPDAEPARIESADKIPTNIGYVPPAVGKEKPRVIHGILRILPSLHATDIMKKYNAIGDEDASTFTLENTNLHRATEELVNHLKREIQK